MKITYLIWGDDKDEELKIICEQTNRLIERGHDVKILTLKKEKLCEHPFKAKIITVSQFNGRIPVSDITVACFGGAALPACKVIKEIPFYIIQNYEPGLYANLRYKEVCEASYKLPLNLLCVSNWLRDLLRKRFLRQSNLLPPGIDLEQLKPKPGNLHIKSSNKRLLMIYRDTSIKGFTDGLNAFKIVRKKFPNVELVICGKKVSQGNSPPIFLCNLREKELSEIYSSADVFVSSSLEEGFGLHQLEAMACKVPVVTTDSKGIREYAIDGRTALIVPPQNPERLAEAIIRLLEDDELRNRIADNGYQKAREFNWEKIIDRLEELFNMAIEIYSQRPPQDWSEWEKVLMLNPDDIWAHHAFGVELQKIGNLDRARNEFERCIELDSDLPFVYQSLGELLLRKGDRHKAIEYLEIAKEKLNR